MTQEKLNHLQQVRNNIPEPTRVEAPVMKFVWPFEPIDFNFLNDLSHSPVAMSSIKTGELHRQLFFYDGAKFWAWTYDGKTPLFPGL